MMKILKASNMDLWSKPRLPLDHKSKSKIPFNFAKACPGPQAIPLARSCFVLLSLGNTATSCGALKNELLKYQESSVAKLAKIGQNCDFDEIHWDC